MENLNLFPLKRLEGLLALKPSPLTLKKYRPNNPLHQAVVNAALEVSPIVYLEEPFLSFYFKRLLYKAPLHRLTRVAPTNNPLSISIPQFLREVALIEKIDLSKLI